MSAGLPALLTLAAALLAAPVPPERPWPGSPAAAPPAPLSHPAEMADVGTATPAVDARAPAAAPPPPRPEGGPQEPAPVPLLVPGPPSHPKPPADPPPVAGTPGQAPAEPVQPTVPTAPPAAPALTQAMPVCRDPRIEGTAIPAIMHESWPCGIAQPVRVRAISGILLSTPAVVDCNTASMFATWLTGVVEPAARAELGSGVDKVWVMGSYACRRRNNMPSGKLSEHARGRAVDIGGVWLEDGRKITLLEGWGKGAEGRFLEQIRGRACGLFHTVLGPGSDRHHADHLHIDTSPRGGEPYCD